MSDVPEGYKVSEVGVIPEDWKVKELGEIGDLTSSKRIFESEYVSNGIPFYRGKEISMLINNEPITDELYITDEKYNKIKKIFGVPKKGDILITAVGTLGNVYSIPNERRFYFKDGNLIWIKDIHSADSKFFAYQIGQKKNEIYNNAIGSSQKALTIVVLKKIQIPLPPTIEEEQAIASALSDVDALITALEHLIAKKRNIKQGAMQQLLTGKKRLPGFSGEWKVKKLGEKDITEIDSDNLNSNTNPNYSFKYISLEDVEQGILKSYTECTFSSAPSRARRKVQKNDILFGTVRPNLKSHLFIKNDTADLICSTGFSVIRTNIDTVNAEFIFHHLFANVIDRQINTLLSGSNYPAINGLDVKSLQIPFPPLPEQQAIAQILCDMDAEIESLEQKRNKYKAIKQGMMQELLTGKTRLI